MHRLSTVDRCSRVVQHIVMSVHTIRPENVSAASFGVNLCKFARYSRWDVRCECEVYLVGHFCVIHDTFCVRVSMVQHDGKF